MICNNCGKENPEKAQTCSICGANLSETHTPQEPSASNENSEKEKDGSRKEFSEDQSQPPSSQQYSQQDYPQHQYSQQQFSQQEYPQQQYSQQQFPQQGYPQQPYPQQEYPQQPHSQQQFPQQEYPPQQYYQQQYSQQNYAGNFPGTYVAQTPNKNTKIIIFASIGGVLFLAIALALLFTLKPFGMNNVKGYERMNIGEVSFLMSEKAINRSNEPDSLYSFSQDADGIFYEYEGEGYVEITITAKAYDDLEYKDFDGYIKYTDDLLKRDYTEENFETGNWKQGPYKGYRSTINDEEMKDVEIGFEVKGDSGTIYLFYLYYEKSTDKKIIKESEEIFDKIVKSVDKASK